MDVSNALKLKQPDFPELTSRLVQVTDSIEEFEKNYNAQNNSFFNYSEPSEERTSIMPSEIHGKEELLFLSSLLPELNKRKSKRDAIQISIITNLLYKYSLSKISFTDDEFYHFVNNWQECKDSYTFNWSKKQLFNILLKKVEQDGLNEILLKTLLLFTASGETLYLTQEQRKINEKINYLLQGAASIAVNQHDEWGPVVLKFINALTDKNEKENWINLLNHCLKAGDKSYPAKNWLQKAESLLKEIEPGVFSATLTEWLSFNAELIQSIHKNERTDFLRDVNHDLLKSLIWCAGFANDTSLNIALDNYAVTAYKKKQWQGPISAKTGTACMYAFSLLPFKEGVTRLMKFRNRIINNTILKSIDKIIGEIAQRHGYDKDLIEEIGVMDFGLDENGSKKIIFDSVVCELEAKTGDVLVNWYKDGKPAKAPPAVVKTNHSAAFKELKNEIKELTAQLQVQKDRIENYYLRKKKWTYEEWLELYIHHPLVKIVASRLIWRFKNNGEIQTGIFLDNNFVNAEGGVLSGLNESTEVELWHPINAALDEIVNWRKFIQDREITQPFKQAYREIYLLTDAEIKTNTYSNRFAAHILRQHQFAALCKQRNWKYTLMGAWDSHNTPSVHLPQWKMMAEYYVEADWNGETGDSGIFSYITTDQVRFYGAGDLLQLIDVPKLVFSEIMRDVDLFVGVASIGNDSQWTDTGDNRHNTYWREYSFGDLSESAKMRSEVLQRLIPRLKIRDCCSFEGKFLIVKGKIRTYKIHMGSGNILMEPNDQYLCIVPDGRTRNDSQKIYLPFEGDNLLSIIISKALLLAEDDKINDDTIVRQLKAE